MTAEEKNMLLNKPGIKHVVYIQVLKQSLGTDLLQKSLLDKA